MGYSRRHLSVVELFRTDWRVRQTRSGRASGKLLEWISLQEALMVFRTHSTQKTVTVEECRMGWTLDSACEMGLQLSLFWRMQKG
jgi:hypothetical protein